MLRINRLIVLLSAALLAVFCYSCKDSSGPTDPEPVASSVLPALTIRWGPENSIICFGTSLTYGYRSFRLGYEAAGPYPGVYAANPLPDYVQSYARQLASVNFLVDSSYPYYLGQRLKIRVENQGYVGAKSDYGLRVLRDSVLTKHPALVLLEFGANDMLQRVPTDTAEAHINLMVSAIKNYGSAVVLISFINPDMVEAVGINSPLLYFKDSALAYYAMLQRVAKRYSVEMIDYPLSGIFGQNNLMSDLIHPNGLGYKKMEENIALALSATFEKNTMYK